MRTYLIKRLLLMIPTIFGISLVVFIIITNAPGSPAALKVSQGQGAGNISADQVASKETYQIFKKHFNLDKGVVFNNYPWLSREKVRRRMNQWMSKSPKESIRGSDALSDYGSYAVPHLVSLLEEARDAARGISAQDAPGNAVYRQHLVFLLAQNALVDIKQVHRKGADPTPEESEREALNEEYQIENALMRDMVVSDGCRPDQASRVEEMWIGWFRGLKALYPAQAEVLPGRIDEAFAGALSAGKAQDLARAGREFGAGLGPSGFASLASWVLAKDDASLHDASMFAANALLAAIAPPVKMSAQEESLWKKWSAVLVAWKPEETGKSANPVKIARLRERWRRLVEGREHDFHQTAVQKVMTGLFDTRFAHYWRNLAVLDFGYSMQFKGKKVSELIWSRLKVSVTFALLSFLIAYSIAIPLGIFSAVYKDSIADRTVTLMLFVMYSMPSFFVAVLLQRLFTVDKPFEWFPIGGFESAHAENLPVLAHVLDIAWHLVLPVVCLTMGSFAALSRYMRAGLLEVIRSDYIRTARAKGLSEFKVIFKHAVRNGLIPILTMIGNILPALVGGSVIIEVIFGIPGMGQLIVDAIFARDYNLVMADSLIVGYLVLLEVLVSDFLYVLVDPRISFE